MTEPDLDDLLSALLKMAETLLADQGAFLPIGAIILANGELHHVGAQIEGEEYPGAQPLLELLTNTFQKEAAEGKLRAAGIAYDVLTVPPGRQLKQDAICCSLEHCLGEAVNVFKPYAKTDEGGFPVRGNFCLQPDPSVLLPTPAKLSSIRMHGLRGGGHSHEPVLNPVYFRIDGYSFRAAKQQLTNSSPRE